MDIENRLPAPSVFAVQREIVWVHGGDAISFLDDLLSQEVAQAPPGSVRRGMLLTPRGMVRSMFWQIRDQTRVGLVGDETAAEIIIGDLGRFRIRVDVEFARDGRDLIEIVGPGAHAAAARAVGRELNPGSWWDDGTVLAVDLAFAISPTRRVLLGGVSVEDLVAAGGVAGPESDREAWRIEAGEPRVAVDLDDRTIPQETGMVEGAIDFEKGCYLGQELVARIASRGRVNRRLVGVVAGEGRTLEPGAVFDGAGVEVGRVGSAAWSEALGSFIGLATLRREVIDGSEVTVEAPDGPVVARVSPLPLVS